MHNKERQQFAPIFWKLREVIVPRLGSLIDKMEVISEFARSLHVRIVK